MTEQEKQIQIALGTYLPYMWKECEQLFTEGLIRFDEAKKLDSVAMDFTPLGDKLIIEGRILYTQGMQLYIDAVNEVYEKKEVEINWANGELVKATKATVVKEVK
jgi:hypothetical protein